MQPHYQKEARYPRTVCWSLAALVGLAMWWLLIQGLSALGACVLNGSC
jgi:hypothetical protein